MKKILEKLFDKVEYKVLNLGKEVELTGMEYDSRKVKDGNIFVALDGAIVDGHRFIEQSIKLGGKMILVSKEVEILDRDVTYIFIKDLRKHLGIVASNFYGWPQRKMKVIGITGTNGKTTTTYILEKLLGDKKVTRIGTVEYKIGDRVIPAPNTTPESLDLVKICDQSIKEGIDYLIMEVSSHALEMGRVAMLEFDIAAFSNLTIDHLDFHKTVEGYFQAKRKMFLKLKDPSNGVYNIGDTYGEKLYREFKGLSFGDRKGDLAGEILEVGTSTQRIKLSYKGENYEVTSNLQGHFNMLNILTGIGICLKLGEPIKEIVKRVEEIKGVPGRFETIDCGQDFSVVVDYAHTGDGLRNILEALKELKKSRIITIFGCGGNKGRDKRFGMGEASCKLSDYTILTADNPRTEPIEDIMEDIKKGFINDHGHLLEEKFQVINDREEAIKKGIEMAQPGDILLIAGKGHETTQSVGTETFLFDDRIEAKKYLESLKGEG